MKRFLLSIGLLASISQAALAGNWFGAGPWANDGYYPGYLNGKYQAAVTGQNIIGVIGFAIVDGAPASREIEVQAGSGALITETVLRNIQYTVDPFQNYFVIFHEGRTYRGLTTAMIDLAANTVTGAFQGTDPLGNQPFVADTTVGGAVNTALPIINRGVNGGFLANINEKGAVLTFSGTGQLSSPANDQTVTMSARPILFDPLNPPASPAGTITNLSASGSVQTESSPFNIRGIRTSFFATNAAPTQQN
jgi:hypothetical protein